MLIQRLSARMVADKDFMENFYRAVAENPGSCDEVWLCSYYGWPPLSKHRELCETFKLEAKRLRAAGIKVSVQLSNTIGHGDYQLGNDCSGMIYEGSRASHLTGLDGVAGRCNFCYRDGEFTDYVVEEARIYSELLPDSIWVDDDYGNRGHSPTVFGCFCDDCIAKFNEKYGFSYNRESLAREYLHGDVSVREKYIDFTCDGLYKLTYAIARAIHEVSPDTVMGFQHGLAGSMLKHSYNCMFKAAMDATGQKEVRVRPGAGAYNDKNPDEFPQKCATLFGLISLFDDCASYIAPEIESLPNVVFGKSVAGTCFETSTYLAGGANHMSYASMQNKHEGFEDYHARLLSEFSRHRPYWDMLVEVNERTYASGIRAYSPEYGYLRELPEDIRMCDFHDDGLGRQIGYLNCALPICFDKRENSVIFLDAALADKLSARDIENLEGMPVVCDGAVLETLVRLGMKCDVTPTEIKKDDLYGMSEVYVKNDIFTESDGYIWGGASTSAVFYGDRSYSLSFPEGKATVLSRYAKNGKDMGAAVVVTTTAKGAKWAIFGSSTNMSYISTTRQRQFAASAEYVSGKPLPALLEKPFSAYIFPRSTEDGRVAAVSVLNKTVGESGETSLVIYRPEGKAFSFMSRTVTSKIPLKAECIGDELYRVTLPSIPAWSVATVFVEG